MKRIVLMILVCILFISFGAVALAQTSEIVGTWVFTESDEYGDYTLTVTFGSDGTWSGKDEGSFEGETFVDTWNGRYEIDGNILRTWEEGYSEPDEVGFRIEGDRLIISPPGEEPLAFIRSGITPTISPLISPSKTPSEIIGTWIYNEPPDEYGESTMTMTFNADGTWEGKVEEVYEGDMDVEYGMGTFEIIGNVLRLWEEGETEPEDANFKVAGDILTVTPQGDAPLVFVRSYLPTSKSNIVIDSDIVGTWELKEWDEYGESTLTVTFNEDGTWEGKEVEIYEGKKDVDFEKGRYEVNGNVLKIWEGGDTTPEELDFKVIGNRLIITEAGDDRMVFTRK